MLIHYLLNVVWMKDRQEREDGRGIHLSHDSLEGSCLTNGNRFELAATTKDSSQIFVFFDDGVYLECRGRGLSQ